MNEGTNQHVDACCIHLLDSEFRQRSPLKKTKPCKMNFFSAMPRTSALDMTPGSLKHLETLLFCHTLGEVTT